MRADGTLTVLVVTADAKARASLERSLKDDYRVLSAAGSQDASILLEAEEVRLQRGHVGEQERQALEPAIGQVQDIQGGDVQVVHRAPLRGLDAIR